MNFDLGIRYWGWLAVCDVLMIFFAEKLKIFCRLMQIIDDRNES